MLSAYWNLPDGIKRFLPLRRDGHFDVVVIGGGITGITAAYLLKQAGHTVAVVERRRLTGWDTGATTAHLSFVTDASLSDLVKTFGREQAQAAWQAGQAAIAQIHAFVEGERVDCGFAWVPGYLHAQPDSGDDEVEWLRNEAALAADLGFDARYIDRAPLVNLPAVEYPRQARFHPAPYLTKMIAAIDGGGCELFEETAVRTVETDPLTVVAAGHRLTCDRVIVATHNPIMGRAHMLGAALLQTKLALYTSYVVSGRVEAGRLPDGLFWDTAHPYRYLRLDRRGRFDEVILGGEDHKTGQEADPDERFLTLEEALSRIAPGVELTHRWSGQVIETPDGLPYIGESEPGQFVATGFNGNGITFGTIAAMMIRDAIVGRANPWAELFDVSRKTTRAAWEYVKENADYPYYLIRDRVAGPEGRSLGVVPPGEGRIVDVDGHRLAVYRHSNGDVTALSPVCTHLGCHVAWNNAEHTWDCPCHGSRFSPTGDVLAGPAESGLEEIPVDRLTHAK